MSFSYYFDGEDFAVGDGLQIVGFYKKEIHAAAQVSYLNGGLHPETADRLHDLILKMLEKQ